ncbi:DUF748 domain-containing protein [Nitrospira lenta]|uniref:DUF748 domain-containing protein n=1 Tax=Nitrospira lenta TaxID=1436998 RepID=A0A330L6A4_9BACT|nr:DUF748 domain-containing protein [Nitrospira lenta]SPP65392.1 conserved exported hypothetical protein [Nitrospira lenta]
MRRFFRPLPLAIGSGVALLLYALVGFFLLPYLITTYAVPKVAETIRHPVAVREVAVNPFELSLRITGLEIRESDQTPMVGFEEFFVNFQAVSLFRLAYVFDAIRLTMPYVAAKVAPNGHLNVLDLVPQGAPDDQLPPAKAQEHPGAIPAVQIGVFEITQGIVEFRDESKPKPVAIDIVPIGIVLRNFHTKPGGDNTYSFSAELGKGEVLDWKGTITLEPIRSEGALVLSGVRIPTIFQYVQGQFNFDIPTGTIDAKVPYRLDMGVAPMDCIVSEASLHLSDVGLVEKGSVDPVISVPSFRIDGIQVDLRQHTVSIASVGLADASDRVWLNPDKSLNLQALFAPAESGPVAEKAPPKTTPKESAKESSPWSVAVKDVQIKNHTIRFEDRSLPSTMQAKVVVRSARSHDLAWPIKGPIPLTVDQTINDTGTFALDGQMVVSPFQADFTLALKNLGLAPFEPYLEQATRVGIDDGSLDVDGSFHLAVEHPKAPLMTFRGNLGVKSLALVNREEGLPVVSWKHLLLKQIALTVDPTTVSLAEVGLDQLRVQLAVQSDGTMNLAHLVKAQKETEVKSAPAPEPPPGKSKPAPDIAIKTVKLTNGAVIFQDDSISPTVRTGLEELSGTVKGLSSKQVAKADVDLSGKLGRVAPLRVVGKINPLSENAFTDISVKFDNIDLTTAGPYSGKYVGYPIRKGKLFLDLAYKLSQHELEAENKVLIDQLGFGEKTESPDATSLPVPLVVALLKDRKGQIAIDLPVRGNLKDPDFKYGKLLLNTVLNLLGKAVTSPFALIGSLVGGSGEELQAIEFAPGRSDLSAVETKKLMTLVTVLTERPALSLDVTGMADTHVDARVLAEDQFLERLRRFKLEETGKPAGKEPAPVLSPEDESRLTTAWYAKQFPPVAGPPDVPPLSVHEMKGRLLQTIAVDEGQLRLLAQRRAEGIREWLTQQGKIEEARVFILEAGFKDGSGTTVSAALAMAAR